MFFKRRLVFLPDCGKLRVHAEEPVVPSRAGDAAVSADGQPGTGHALGQRSVQQAHGLHLLGFEEEEEEEVLAGSAGTPTSVLSIGFNNVLMENK